LAAISRQRALAAAEHMLDSWNADPLLCRMVSRQAPLLPWPPPGADRIVDQYVTEHPTQAASA